MAPPRVLRFPRSDDKEAFVLLQITPKGSKPLDLRLAATEGEAPYVASLKHDRVAALRVKNCPVSESEWQTILERLLQLDPLPDIQATATVESGSSVSITVRKETQGITQRLGAITLSHDPDEAIELFDWCAAAVGVSANSRQEMTQLKTKLEDANASVAQLKSQLEELVKAKEEDETALLQKFRDLLNEKKVKIREQQQVLASGNLGANDASRPGFSPPVKVEPQDAPEPAPRRKAGPSRTSKRKTPASRRVEESEEDDAGNDVDIKQEPEDSDPGNTTEATASGSDDDDDDAEAVNSEENSEEPPTVPLAKGAKSPPKKSTEQPPVRRELPFGNRKPTKAVPKPAPASDTDSDDEV